MSRALVVLAERGVQSEIAAREALRTSYNRFMSEKDPRRKQQSGEDLMRSVFGKDALAEDPVR
jgi:hypothetical protein